MAIIRWAPLRETAMLRQMDRLLVDVFTKPKAETFFAPAMELREQPNAYILRTALPGVKSEDLDIQVDPTAVSIRASHSYSKYQEQEVAHGSEFRYGKFSRQLSLPGRVDTDKVQADFQDGILTLTLPKAEPSTTRKIPVTAGIQALPTTNGDPAQ
ncbi:Hsp20/alpha crystallin family protein [Candidatus Cyanaurora vandensis]|uniref:Hsp20/alpha crystallin family protein n=1 Tax=Candidatus Cyanaurora vandensis TaxID=2714958 RepID=UPI00257959F2|nr:Hsp20/alpha crystallin family protein [Candidatus Cyanaurora vandensis]